MKFAIRIAHLKFSLVLLVLLLGASAAMAQDEYASVKKWENFEFAKHDVTRADL